MPFTLFHLCLGLLIVVLFRKRLDLVSVLIGSVILDVWPFLVLFFSLGYSLHGVSHSFFVAIIASCLLALITFKVYQYFRIKRKFYFLFWSFIVGTFSHVLLDSPLYSDALPFWPSKINLLFGLYSYNSSVLFSIVCLFLAGVIFLINRKHY